MNQTTQQQSTTQQQWAWVLARSREHDGEFVYAVKSTGVYCRPSCPSRRPRQDSVEFFSSPERAEAAGYRSCRRCRPNRQDAQIEYVRRVCQYIDDNPDGDLSLAALSRIGGVSRFHLLRMFQRVLGITPRQYREQRSMQLVKLRLSEGTRVTDAIYDAGFGSSSRFYEKSHGQLGMTPATYRNGGSGAEIRYTVFSSALGKVLIAATARGVCSVRLGDDEEPLIAELTSEFANASIRRDDDNMTSWVSPVREFLAGHCRKLDLPLDIRATAFQRRVWQVIRDIPFGETRTYKAVAETLGQPAASRAVARACASNPVALAIPCHRVVGQSGKPAGYRWGVQRKTALLKAENSVYR